MANRGTKIGSTKLSNTGLHPMPLAGFVMVCNVSFQKVGENHGATPKSTAN